MRMTFTQSCCVKTFSLFFKVTSYRQIEVEIGIEVEVFWNQMEDCTIDESSGEKKRKTLFVNFLFYEENMLLHQALWVFIVWHSIPSHSLGIKSCIAWTLKHKVIDGFFYQTYSSFENAFLWFFFFKCKEINELIIAKKIKNSSLLLLPWYLGEEKTNYRNLSKMRFN